MGDSIGESRFNGMSQNHLGKRQFDSIGERYFYGMSQNLLGKRAIHIMDKENTDETLSSLKNKAFAQQRDADQSTKWLLPGGAKLDVSVLQKRYWGPGNS